jgi:hypothetical protein
MHRDHNTVWNILAQAKKQGTVGQAVQALP